MSAYIPDRMPKTAPRKMSEKCRVEFQMICQDDVRVYRHRPFQKLLQCSFAEIDEMRRSRMVLPGVGSPQAQKKTNDIKIDLTQAAW